MCEVLQREDMRHPLISCGGDGTVHVYDMSNVKTPPVLLCQVMERLNPAWFNKLKSIDSHRHAFKVDPKLTRIAFGLTNGFIEIYNLKTLKLIYTSDYQRDCITSLDWKCKLKRICPRPGLLKRLHVRRGRQAIPRIRKSQWPDCSVRCLHCQSGERARQVVLCSMCQDRLV